MACVKTDKRKDRKKRSLGKKKNNELGKNKCQNSKDTSYFSQY